MRFLSKWVLSRDKTHFSKSQKKPTSTKPPHPHVALFEENPLIQEPPLMETTIFLWNTRTFKNRNRRISPGHNTLVHSFVKEILQNTQK